MNAWLAEILELPARRTLRVGGGGSREVSVSYSSEELCHEAARVVLRLRHEIASNRQQLACLREGGAQPQSPPLAGWRSPKARLCSAVFVFPPLTDAAHIVEEIALLKTRTSGATRTAAAANPIE